MPRFSRVSVGLVSNRCVPKTISFPPVSGRLVAKHAMGNKAFRRASLLAPWREFEIVSSRGQRKTCSPFPPVLVRFVAKATRRRPGWLPAASWDRGVPGVRRRSQGVDGSRLRPRIVGCSRIEPKPAETKRWPLPPGGGVAGGANNAPEACLGSVKKLFGRYQSICLRKIAGIS